MPAFDSCIDSILEPGNPGLATDSGAITIPHYPAIFNVSVAEAASAADLADASLFAIYNVSVVETASAADLLDAFSSAIYSVSVSETAAAASTQDATLVAAAIRSAVVAGMEPAFVTASTPRTSRLRSGTALTVQ